MTDENNVIAFPNAKKDTPPQNIEEFDAKKEKYQRNYSRDFSEMMYNYVFTEMSRDGVDFTENEEELLPSVILVMESITSLHLKANKLHHTLQDFASEAFDGDLSDEKRQELSEAVAAIDEEYEED